MICPMRQHVISSRWMADGAARGARLRLLVETADPVAEISDFRSFRQAGIDVAVCSGPGPQGSECPMVTGRRCALAERADAVLVELPPSSSETHQVVEAMRARHPGTPIVMHVARQPADESSRVPEGVVPLPMPASVDQQIRVVRRAAVDGRRSLRQD